VLRTPVPELPAVARWPQPDEVFPGKGPLQKADWFQRLWRERRLNWWNNRERDRGAVVFLGDSITQGWGTLAQDFPGLKVANRGISGDVTRGVRFRLKEDVLDLQPAGVVLLIGTNDLGLGGNPEDAAENTKALLAAFRAHNPNMPVVVCKVMPRQPQFSEKIQRLNRLVDESVSGNPQFVRCDTWRLFADGQGGAKPDEFPDLLHPNGAGYLKWTEALKPILARQELAR
jgi:lysophospholipase L1-like esterase